MNPLCFHADRLSGNCVQYSPFFDRRLLLGTAANFGIVGNGKLFALEIAPNGISAIAAYDTQDSVFCACWSETHEQQLLAGTGDGSVLLFDCLRPQHPLAAFRPHARECFGLSANLVNKQLVASCSWDGTVALLDLAAARQTTKINCHSGVLYQVKYAPRNGSLLATATASGQAQLVDTRTQQVGMAFALPPGSGECLSVDFNKYVNTQLATGSSDGFVRVWDQRMPAAAVAASRLHALAVKSIKFSPHKSDVLLSASYDMCAKLISLNPNGTLTERMRLTKHTEFVTDADFALWDPHELATTGFDGNAYVWRVS